MLRFSQDTKDKYRPRFCASEFYSEYQSIFNMWKTSFNELSDVEKVQAWVFALACLRRPKDWFGGFRLKPFELEQNLPFNSLTIDSILNPANIKIPAKLKPNLTIKAALNVCRIKPLPEAALRSLYRLTDSNYSVKILNYVPTPYELLNVQTNGYRVISFNEDHKMWPIEFYGERDFLSFILHDLIHADHFLNNEFYKKGQLGFYKIVQSIWHNNSLQTMMLSCEFKMGFEYIISDMNAHPMHLVKTLKALLFESLKNDFAASAIWQDWISIWSKDPAVLSSLKNVNKDCFTTENAIIIEKLCFKYAECAY